MRDHVVPINALLPHLRWRDLQPLAAHIDNNDDGPSGHFGCQTFTLPSRRLSLNSVSYRPRRCSMERSIRGYSHRRRLRRISCDRHRLTRCQRGLFAHSVWSRLVLFLVLRHCLQRTMLTRRSFVETPPRREEARVGGNDERNRWQVGGLLYLLSGAYQDRYTVMANRDRAPAARRLAGRF